MRSAEEIITRLQMEAHPEGGHFVETFRDAEGPEGRGFSSLIYFLLQAGEKSHWHRVDATEIWLWHAGAPLNLQVAEVGKDANTYRLGPDIAQGERPQGIVPKGAWQSACSTGDWSLVSCVVAPGFVFEGFELAAPDWSPVI